MSEVKPYSVAEAAHLAAYHGAPATRCPLEDDRFFETARALAAAQARIEELEAALEAIEKVVEMALECDESMEWLAEKVETVLGKAKP